jgi:hypothetical protein
MKLCERLLELSALLLSPLMLLPKFRAANAAADAQRALLGRKKKPKFIWSRITVTAKGFEERKLRDNECLRAVADAEGSAAAARHHAGAALLLLNSSKKFKKKSHQFNDSFNTDSQYEKYNASFLHHSSLIFTRSPASPLPGLAGALPRASRPISCSNLVIVLLMIESVVFQL